MHKNANMDVKVSDNLCTHSVCPPGAIFLHSPLLYIDVLCLGCTPVSLSILLNGSVAVHSNIDVVPP